MNIIDILKEKNMTISTAESLTGGLLASKICSIPGASNYYKGGIVAYTKDTKCNLLGLKKEDIDKYGVYSFETVKAMAFSILKQTNSDIAISTSGVAGPDVDEGIEAGTVFYCIRINDIEYIEKHVFNGTRNEVRDNCCEYILQKLEELLKK